MNKATNLLCLSLVLAGVALLSASALAPIPGKAPGKAAANAPGKLTQRELGGMIQEAEIRRLGRAVYPGLNLECRSVLRRGQATPPNLRISQS